MLGMLIVLALLLLFLNPKVRAIWPALFTHRNVQTNLNPLSGVSISLPGGQAATVNTPVPVAGGA